jgi:hypothetical protein
VLRVAACFGLRRQQKEIEERKTLPYFLASSYSMYYFYADEGRTISSRFSFEFRALRARVAKLIQQTAEILLPSFKSVTSRTAIPVPVGDSPVLMLCSEEKFLFLVPSQHNSL